MKTKLLKKLIILLIITLSYPAIAIPVEEREALIALYNSTDGDHWTNNSGWLGRTGTECSWYGVSCISGPVTPEQVISINLINNGLTGTIPPELKELSQLIVLFLHANKLTGNIPSELAQLSQLGKLNLSNNQLAGNIPPELGQLSQLRQLFLNNNQLVGKIPPELGLFPVLNTLNLSDNQLTHIPPELGQLFWLRDLRLSKNQLTNIPPELGELSWLANLYLGRNQLTGNIPIELGQLSQLNNLFLHHNNLTGNIPTELTQLSKLTTLQLNDNALTGDIPTELTQLSQLQNISLRLNCLTIDSALFNNTELVSFLNSKTFGIWVDQRTDCPTAPFKAVSVFDDKAGLLIIEEVNAIGKTYYVELQDQQDQSGLQFLLTKVIELSDPVYATPAHYSVETLLVDIPSVLAFGRLYTLQMKNNGSNVFSITKVE